LIMPFDGRSGAPLYKCLMANEITAMARDVRSQGWAPAAQLDAGPPRVH
jgi:hypothetical protein